MTPTFYHNPEAIELQPLPEESEKSKALPNNKPADLGTRQRIATELLGEIEWLNEIKGYCQCPGQHLHTSPDGKRDCEIRLDGAPTIHCFHNSCAGVLAGINHELRSRIGKAEGPTLEGCQFANGDNLDQPALMRLAALSPIEYDRCRKDEAKKLNIKVGTLDEEIAKRRPTSVDNSLQGHEVNLADVEPWPEPANGADVLDKVSETYSKHIMLPDGAADALALWCAVAHVFEAFEYSPRLNIRSPEKGCGKTLTLDVTALFVARAVRTENCTVAVLFRLVEKYRPVILADECDAWMRENEELRGLLNAGYKRGGIVMRCEGDNNEVRGFHVYAPVALGGIGALPGTLHDRSIVITLHRAKPGEVRARFDFRRTQTEQELCRKLARFAADNFERFKTADPALPDGVYNRLADNWRPLFAIAEAAGGDWPKRAADALALLTSRDASEGQSIDVQLLSDIRQLFEAEITKDTIPSTELAETLAGMQGRPWAEYGRMERPLTPTKLARMLNHFGIVSGTKRVGVNTFKGYYRKQFDDAFARYLPPVEIVTTSDPMDDPMFQ